MWEPTFAQGYSQNGGVVRMAGGRGRHCCLFVVHAHIFKSGCFKGCDLHMRTDVLREATSEELCDICHMIYLAVD